MIIIRLDRVLADRKMRLNDLAAQVGISNVNLSYLKTGRVRAVRFSTLDAICKALPDRAVSGNSNFNFFHHGGGEGARYILLDMFFVGLVLGISNPTGKEDKVFVLQVFKIALDKRNPVKAAGIKPPAINNRIKTGEIGRVYSGAFKK